MESKRTSVLTVLSIMITTLVAAYLFTGPGYAIELAVVSLLALGGWLRFSFRETPSQDTIAAPYILIIVLSLILNTSRYWSGYSSFLVIKFGIGYQYFSGMYTALFPMIPAILALLVIIHDHKQRLALSKG